MWLRNAIRNLWRRRRADSELDEEVRDYAELLAEEKIRSGMTAAEARREAKMELGGVEQVKEQTRKVHAGHFLETLWQDLRYGARMLRRSPGFTIVAVLTLALGIGANTAIFSVIESVLLRPLPYDHPQSLIEIWNTYPPAIPQGGASPGDFYDWSREAKTVSEMGGYVQIPQGFNLTGDGDPQRLQVSYATANLFPMLGIHPAVGRLFVAQEDRPGSAPIVLLTHHFWRSRFGADPGVIGHTITLDGLHYTIVGVLPVNSRLLDGPDLWMPLGQYADDLRGRVHHPITAVARLKPGASLAAARQEFEALNRQATLAYPETHKNFGVIVTPMEDDSAVQLRSGLLVLFGAVGLVLLIACANIVNLLLARNAIREKEIALRTALGANPRRLTRQLLTESTLLCLIGGAVGLLLAAAGVRILGAAVPASLAAVQETRLDNSVLLFTIIVCLGAGIVCGLVPALQARRTNVNAALKQSSKGSGALSSRKLHNLVVISEIALALIPLIGAGLLLRSLHELLNVNPGFHADHVLTMFIPQAAIPPAQLSKLTTAQQTQFAEKQSLQFEQIVQRVEGLPGVKSAAGIDVLPLASHLQQATRFVIEGRPIPNAGVRPFAEFRTVTPNYYSTVGIPLLSGRELRQEDWNGLNIDINEAMARRFWPKGNALGKRINLCSLNPQPCWVSIVGIVGNVHQFGLDSAPTYDVYLSGGWTPYLVIRTASDPDRIAMAAIDIVHKVDPALPVANVTTMDELLSDSVSSRRFSATLIGIFAALALVLAAVGIYGVVSYSVAQRTSELGLRMALGAQQGDVFRLVVGQGLKLTSIGICIGLAASFGLMRLMASQLYGVGATDPLTFAGVAIVLTTVALAACYIPARRAMRVDPMTALQYE
jgi:putative ABC transport system permease protein